MPKKEANARMVQAKAWWKDSEAKMKRDDEKSGISFAKESGPSIDHAHKIREKYCEKLDDIALLQGCYKSGGLSLGLLLISCEYGIMELSTQAPSVCNSARKLLSASSTCLVSCPPHASLNSGGLRRTIISFYGRGFLDQIQQFTSLPFPDPCSDIYFRFFGPGALSALFTLSMILVQNCLERTWCKVHVRHEHTKLHIWE